MNVLSPFVAVSITAGAMSLVMLPCLIFGWSIIAVPIVGAAVFFGCAFVALVQMTRSRP